MGEVVELKAANDDGPFASGMMKCLACKHEWAAVAPIPVRFDLECPACHCERGVYKYPFDAVEGEAVYTCGCGNTLMVLKVRKDNSESLVCVGCGDMIAVVS